MWAQSCASKRTYDASTTTNVWLGLFTNNILDSWILDMYFDRLHSRSSQKLCRYDKVIGRNHQEIQATICWCIAIETEKTKGAKALLQGGPCQAVHSVHLQTSTKIRGSTGVIFALRVE